MTGGALTWVNSQWPGERWTRPGLPGRQALSVAHTRLRCDSEHAVCSVYFTQHLQHMQSSATAAQAHTSRSKASGISAWQAQLCRVTDQRPGGLSRDTPTPLTPR